MPNYHHISKTIDIQSRDHDFVKLRLQKCDCSDPLKWGRNYRLKFSFVQSIFTGQYVNIRAMLLVSLESPYSIENGIRKSLIEFCFL